MAKSRRYVFRFLLLAIFCFLAAENVQSQGNYTYITFNSPNSDWTYASGINDYGEVVGSGMQMISCGPSGGGSYSPQGSFQRKSDGTFRTYGNVDGGVVLQAGLLSPKINNGNYIVGGFTDTNGPSGYMYDPNAQTYSFFQVQGDPTEATGINDVGQIVGYYEVPSNPGAIARGFVRSADGSSIQTIAPQDLGISDSNVSVVPRAINNLGDIVGEVVNYDTGVTQSFVMSSSSITLFQVQGSETHASGINDRGDVVGYFGAAGSAMGFFRDASGTITNLTWPDSTAIEVIALDINNSGQIVGTLSGWEACEQEAFIATPVETGTSQVFFPQVVIGGGYTTGFTITNTGATMATGNLVLTDQQGNPYPVNGTLTDSTGTVQPTLLAFNFPITIPAGGTIFLTAAAPTTSSPVKPGWATISSTGGSVSAVATYEYVVGTQLQMMIGVLQSQPLQYATIPVDNESSQSKQLAYAIANPNNQAISIKAALVGQSGNVVDDTLIINLNPGQQIAQYMWEATGQTDFKGSLVFRGQGSATFVVLALLQKQNVFTVTPVIVGKAPDIPN